MEIMCNVKIKRALNYELFGNQYFTQWMKCTINSWYNASKQNVEFEMNSVYEFEILFQIVYRAFRVNIFSTQNSIFLSIVPGAKSSNTIIKTFKSPRFREQPLLWFSSRFIGMTGISLKRDLWVLKGVNEDSS